MKKDSQILNSWLSGERMKIYYSHSKILKGSEQQRQDIQLLESMGYEVDNPYNPIYSDFWESEGFAFSKTLIEKNDALIFRALPDGRIPSGVGKEIGYALEMGKPVIELPFSLKSRMASIDETMEFFQECGHTKAKK